MLLERLARFYYAALSALARWGALAVYFFALTPAALLWRMFNPDALGLRRPPGGPSLRPAGRKFSAADLEKPW